ncbi:hypothetical protein ACN47E_005931 [Coniothyrium glycines]
MQQGRISQHYPSREEISRMQPRKNTAQTRSAVGVLNFGAGYGRTKLRDPLRQIRLLSIAIVTSKPGAPAISCTMNTVDLAFAPAYRALSYVWGHGFSKESIQLNNERIRINTGGYAALEHIAKMCMNNHADWCGLWWIDEICIDQGDEDEKRDQIRIMKRIYRNAREVVAWLGPGDNDVVKAMRQISRVTEPDFRKQFGNTDSQTLLAMRAVFSREYWSRVWILQELAVASRRRLVCGEGELSWQHLLAFTLMLANSEFTDRRFIRLQMDVLSCQRVWLISLIHDDAHARMRLNLAKLVYLSKYSCATDGRDHIIALLGMLPSDVGTSILREGSAQCSVICAAIRRILVDMKANGRRDKLERCTAIAKACKHRPLDQGYTTVEARRRCRDTDCGSLRACRLIATTLYEHDTLYTLKDHQTTIRYGLDRLWHT